jgi:hypothetical protein
MDQLLHAPADGSKFEIPLELAERSVTAQYTERLIPGQNSLSRPPSRVGPGLLDPPGAGGWHSKRGSMRRYKDSLHDNAPAPGKHGPWALSFSATRVLQYVDAEMQYWRRLEVQWH